MVRVAFERDPLLDAAYIRVSERTVARMVVHSDQILIDLDATGAAVGIHVLDPDAVLPADALVSDYGVGADVADLLRLVRPGFTSSIARARAV